MDSLNVNFVMGGKLSVTKENKSISSFTLLATPMLFNPSLQANAVAHKYIPLTGSPSLEALFSLINTPDLQAISVLFGFPSKHPTPAQISSSTSPPIPMNSSTSEMASSDDPESFEGRANLKVLKLLKEKKQECEELKAAVKEANLTRWSLEKQLDLKTNDLTLALQTSESRYVDCMRLDGRLHDLASLEPQLESARSEIKSLKKSVADANRRAELREETFRAEKLSWAEDRERLLARINTLADSLKHARRNTLSESETHPSSPKPENTQPIPPPIPPEIKKELTELRELVPAYVDTLDVMEVTIQNLNAELEDLHQAYTDVVDKSYAQQELIEQLNQHALETENSMIGQVGQPELEAENPIPEGSLAAEISQASCKRPSTSSSESHSKLLKMRKLNEKTKSDEVEDLRQTNQKLNDYLERLLNRIIGLEAFEHVLNVDFEAIRNGHPKQPVVFQAPSVRARRAVSSSLATRTLNQLKTAKSKFLDKLNNSASSGIQLLAHSFPPQKTLPDQFNSFAMLLPRSTSKLGSVDYAANLGKSDKVKR
ncbi:uncharacterized protein PGTG_05240 [Puccinia graminis f. sp. tritici CRL 75-36-700-3]|uniref:Uncharacterized protein n=1 Tax=Puccinia graminis f. sp. tritici (strain CRL 75-36-700-3 / race SCCL) TaxID=418459 RepID=E3K6I6_PUCGT|nr:uncharacterized protein PGTG_05240 [Puccinia graminis f. sp. tritici CRL 75-36-700-3]EFP80015.2 hypothetical protein PGTG_05240 [Puccinia graminis f. sp. tritici CRL 75-36-700-3]